MNKFLKMFAYGLPMIVSILLLIIIPNLPKEFLDYQITSTSGIILAISELGVIIMIYVLAIELKRYILKSLQKENNTEN